MICKLCGEDRPLIRAHIIPEAFFRELRDGGRAPLMVTNSPSVFPRRAPIGVYDSTILCSDCENKFSVCDSYGAEVLLSKFSELFKPLSRGQDTVAYAAEGVNQPLLQRFFASVLWRASVSSQLFFSNIRLGPLADSARRVFLDESPEDGNLFSTVLTKWTASEQRRNLTTAMMNPFGERWDGVNAYRIYFGEITAYIKADKRPFKEPLRGLEVGARDTLFITTRHLDDSKELRVMKLVADASPESTRRPELPGT